MNVAVDTPNLSMVIDRRRLEFQLTLPIHVLILLVFSFFHPEHS